MTENERLQKQNMLYASALAAKRMQMENERLAQHAEDGGPNWRRQLENEKENLCILQIKLLLNAALEIFGGPNLITSGSAEQMEEAEQILTKQLEGRDVVGNAIADWDPENCVVACNRDVQVSIIKNKIKIKSLNSACMNDR